MKTYGIYVAYPPSVDLRAEGLGRHLGEFLKQAANRSDVSFVIACPSWTRKALHDLLVSNGIATDAFEILGPDRKPMLLALHDWYMARRGRTFRRERLKRLLTRLRSGAGREVVRVARMIVATRNFLLLALVGLIAAPLVAIAWLARSIGQLLPLVRGIGRSIARRTPSVARYRQAADRLAAKPQSNGFIVYLYGLMADAEAELIVGQINRRTDIVAWYSPTAFWPEFNRISAPRLTCVPDVVLSAFPVGFSSVGGDRFLQTFRHVQASIAQGQRFITYSAHVKKSTLVEQYDVRPADVHVVPHGANALDGLVTVSGFPDTRAATDKLCATLLHAALAKAIDCPTADLFDPGDLQFLFFASQFRPNKNVISLLWAYEHLLKRRYIGHKLILTGNPRTLPEIGAFIREHNLQNDVLCLHGLTAQEVAACYRLADLAVNPSLSEGGCPFTLTEALSVGTPVVMGRIAVTEEVVTEPDLQSMMLFDPYDWRDMAARIEWALQNRDTLLERQMVLYRQLEKRSWRNVVDEHIAVLDDIAANRQSRVSV